MSDTIEYNVNDIVEEYSRISGKGVAKYLVTNKIFTKHRGVFYDLLALEHDQHEKPVPVYGYRLINRKDHNLHFRKFFDAQKQI